MQPEPGPFDEQPAAVPPKSGRNLPIAIATGLGLAGLVIWTLFWALLPWAILVAAALLTSLVELYRTTSSARTLAPAQSVGFAGLLIMVFGTAWRGPIAMSFGLAVAAIVAFLWYLVDAERTRVTDNLALTLFGLVYVGMFGAHAVAMARLPHGPNLTIVWLGAVVFADVGAYAAGSFFGKHKMAPRISPGKTWEGTLGATLLVFLLALTIGPLFDGIDLVLAAAIAGIVVVLAPIGDLAESLIKRDLGVKDMGGLLPGHGGVLDRIDALLFTAPFAYWFLRAAA